MCVCRTYTWIDDQEARPNVSYVLASGSKIAIGGDHSSWQRLLTNFAAILLPWLMLL